jgi:aspartate aminotransferase
MATTGGIHALYLICQALLEPGDEVIMPDPEWPPAMGNVKLAHGVVVPCRLHESLGWRWNLDELDAAITPRTKAIYVNSPHNPSGGVLTRTDLERIAAIAEAHGLWILSDEAYEDVIYEGEHVSPASLPGMYARTIPFFTMSKTYAITGLRLGYAAVRDPVLRDRMKKVLFYTASNTSSVVQYGGIGALEGSQECVELFRTELLARRDLFYDGIRQYAGDILSGAPPKGAFYAFLKIDPRWRSDLAATGESISWALARQLIERGRIGCVPGADFGVNGEGYVRFCFARGRDELNGALESMQRLFAD